ncbi:MAG TPA: hypothetical protein VMM15_14480, partial [Bradyrhizobium sp.]|nr:hypothetical protein [Bradyrhizobium sp.]
MHLPAGEMQRRPEIIGDAFLAQVVKDRIVDNAVWIGESPPKGLAGIAHIDHRTVEKSTAIEQFEAPVSDHRTSLGMPNEPASDDLRMQRAHEHSDAPQLQSGCGQPLAEFSQHFL